MTRIEFIDELNHRLKGISQSERDDALNYYEEIFDEQGLNYDDVIPDRYDPMKIARDILITQRANQWQKHHLKKRKNKDGLLLIILAIVSLPVTIPLIAILFSLLIAVVAVLFALLVAGIAIIGAGIGGILHFLTSSVSSVIFFLGMTLVGIGSIVLLFNVARFIIQKLAGTIAGKTKKKNHDDDDLFGGDDYEEI